MPDVNTLLEKYKKEKGRKLLADKEKARKLLADINVCDRCVVRILRRNYDFDFNIYETEVPKGSHCPTCLGILEIHFLYSVSLETNLKLWQLGQDYSVVSGEAQT